MRVLLVEDEQSMLFTLSNLLKHRGYEVIAAHSAEKVWKHSEMTRWIW